MGAGQAPTDAPVMRAMAASGFGEETIGRTRESLLSMQQYVPSTKIELESAAGFITLTGRVNALIGLEHCLSKPLIAGVSGISRPP
jgi:hypothetical protein